MNVEHELQLKRKLALVHQALPVVGKTGEADTGSYKYSYAELPVVLRQLNPILDQHQLYLSFPVLVREGQNLQYVRIVDLETGAHEESHIDLGKYNGPQDAGKAMTYLKRYLLLGLLGIVADDDDAQGVEQVQVQAADDQRKLNFLTASLPLLLELAVVSPQRLADFLQRHTRSLADVPSAQRGTIYKEIEAQLQLAVDEEAAEEAEGDAYSSADGDVDDAFYNHRDKDMVP